MELTEAEALAPITDAELVMEVTYEVTGDPKGYVVSQLPFCVFPISNFEFQISPPKYKINKVQTTFDLS